MPSEEVPLAGVEAQIDIEYTVGIAIGVPVEFLTVGGNASNFDEALLDTTTILSGVDEPPTVMTTSYGDNENNFTLSLAV